MKKSDLKNMKNDFKKPLKKIVPIVLAVVALCAFCILVVSFNNSKKDYDNATKNAIAMGTVVTAKTFGEGAAQKNERIVSIIRQLDETISWRIDGSSVSILNKNRSVKLAELASIVAKCNEVSKDSDGAFDISIGKVSRLWDFGGENERLPSEDEIKKALETVDYKKLSVSGNGVVSVSDGRLVDLGAVGKGYACDMIKSYLEMTDVPGAVVSVGGSILAYGSRNKAGDNWRIAIRHPRREGKFLGTIQIKNGFVSTSGDYEKFFEKDGVRFHHILDARTGYPAKSDLISVTIVCDNGALSDALSTACFILGSEKGKALCEKYNADAVFVNEDLEVTLVGNVNFEKAS